VEHLGNLGQVEGVNRFLSSSTSDVKLSLMSPQTDLTSSEVKPSSSLHRQRAVSSSSGKTSDKVINRVTGDEDEEVSDEDLAEEPAKPIDETAEVEPDTPKSESESDLFSPPTADKVWRAWKSKAKEIAQERRCLPRVAWTWPCPYPYCDETFDDRDELFVHYANTHPTCIVQPGAKDPLRCPFCGKGYKSSQTHTMRGHQRKEHRSNRWGGVGEAARRVDGGRADGDHQEALFREAAVRRGRKRRTE